MDSTQNIGRPFGYTSVTALCLLLIFLAVSVGLAGEIFGTIKVDGKVVPKGVKVDITTPVKTYSGETDTYGSYRLYVAEKGKCSLTVHFAQKAPSIQIFSYPKSTRYDFTIEKKDTVYTLKRK
jgi:hypothetical protein